MTERELTEKYLHSIGYRFLKRGDSRDDLAPILPFIILDIYYGYYNKGLKWDRFTQRRKKLMKNASGAYNRLNKSFFDAFDDDEKDAVIELMDKLQESVKNQVLITEVAAWNVFKDLPDCDTITCAFMCNSLAKAAQAVWRVVYRDGKRHPLPNKDIDTLLHSTKAFAETICDTDCSTDNERHIKNLLAAEDALGRGIVSWLFSEKQL